MNNKGFFISLTIWGIIIIIALAFFFGFFAWLTSSINKFLENLGWFKLPFLFITLFLIIKFRKILQKILYAFLRIIR